MSSESDFGYQSNKLVEGGASFQEV